MIGFGMATTSPQVLHHAGGAAAPVQIAVQPGAIIRASAGKCTYRDVPFQVGATGIISIQYRAWPALTAIGVGRVTNNGNPVSQTVAQAITAETDFVLDFTIDATDGWFLDAPSVVRLGPFTMPPVGGSGDFDGFPQT